MKLLRAVSGVLGSGVVVVPALLDARAGAPLVAAWAPVTVVLAAVLFRARPFGGLAGSVAGLPAAARAVYSVGFLGGSVYFAASAAALLRAIWRLPAWSAVACVAVGVVALGQVLIRRPLPPAGVALRCLLALAVAALLPLTDRPAELLGPAAGQLPLPVLVLAALLVCVGWESLPALRLDRRTAATAVLVCAVATGAACGWAAATGLRGAPDGRWDVGVGTAAAGLLILFAAGNSAALAAFWASRPARTSVRTSVYSALSPTSARTGQLWAAGAILAGYAALARAGLDRGWALLLPGSATLVLYLGFALSAVRHPPAAARGRDRIATG